MGALKFMQQRASLPVDLAMKYDFRYGFV